MYQTQTRQPARLISIALVLFASGTILLVGCGKSQLATLAGGKSVDHWVQALAVHNVKIREEAVTKLGNVGTADPAAIPALIGALKDSSAKVRCGAIFALAKSPQAAQEAIAPITELQQHDHDPKVRDLAAKGLRRLQGGSAAKEGAGSS
jgi:HEAT repeat protein